MKITKKQLKRIIKEELLKESEEWQANDDHEDLITTDAQTAIREFVAKMDELASSVGFVPMSKEPAVMNGLNDYMTDLSHQLRGHIKNPSRVNELGPATGHEEGTSAIDIVKQIGDDLIEVAGEMREMPSHVPASNVAGFIESKGKEALEAHAELAGADKKRKSWPSGV